MSMKDSNGVVRNLTSQQQKSMIFLFTYSQERRKMIGRTEKLMHAQFDPFVQEVEYPCIYCPQKFKGKSIGAHYRNSEACKYMKDRPWLKVLPANWKQDLQRFLEEENDV